MEADHVTRLEVRPTLERQLPLLPRRRPTVVLVPVGAVRVAVGLPLLRLHQAVRERELAHRPVVRRNRPWPDEELPVPDEQHPAPVLSKRVLERLGDVRDDGAVAVPFRPGDLLGGRGVAGRCRQGAVAGEAGRLYRDADVLAELLDHREVARLLEGGREALLGEAAERPLLRLDHRLVVLRPGLPRHLRDRELGDERRLESRRVEAPDETADAGEVREIAGRARVGVAPVEVEADAQRVLGVEGRDLLVLVVDQPVDDKAVLAAGEVGRERRRDVALVVVPRNRAEGLGGEGAALFAVERERPAGVVADRDLLEHGGRGQHHQAIRGRGRGTAPSSLSRRKRGARRLATWRSSGGVSKLSEPAPTVRQASSRNEP